MADAHRALATLAPVVRAFVQRHQIPKDAVRGSGRVALTVDRYRVQLLPAPHHRVALQAELMALPEQGTRRVDDLLLRLARMGAGLLQLHGSTLCIDAQRQALVLQQAVPANAELPVLEEALADFTNALAFWHRVCERERAAMAPPAAADSSLARR